MNTTLVSLQSLPDYWESPTESTKLRVRTTPPNLVRTEARVRLESPAQTSTTTHSGVWESENFDSFTSCANYSDVSCHFMCAYELFSMPPSLCHRAWLWVVMDSCIAFLTTSEMHGTMGKSQSHEVQGPANICKLETHLRYGREHLLSTPAPTTTTSSAARGGLPDTPRYAFIPSQFMLLLRSGTVFTNPLPNDTLVVKSLLIGRVARTIIQNHTCPEIQIHAVFQQLRALRPLAGVRRDP